MKWTQIANGYALVTERRWLILYSDTVIFFWRRKLLLFFTVYYGSSPLIWKKSLFFLVFYQFLNIIHFLHFGNWKFVLSFPNSKVVPWRQIAIGLPKFSFRSKRLSFNCLTRNCKGRYSIDFCCHGLLVVSLHKLLNHTDNHAFLQVLARWPRKLAFLSFETNQTLKPTANFEQCSKKFSYPCKCISPSTYHVFEMQL